MPKIIDPKTIHVDDLPGVWSPVQWELTESERIGELEDQAQASMLWAIDAPETILRLLLGETAIGRAHEPPKGWDQSAQGDWNPDLITFSFKRRFKLIKQEREPDHLYVEYKAEDLGHWGIEIEAEKVTIQRL